MSLPASRLSKKNSEMPPSVSSTVTTSSARGFLCRNRNEKSRMKIGAVYCRTMAFAAVVYLLATTKQMKTPHSRMPLTSVSRERMMRCFVSAI